MKTKDKKLKYGYDVSIITSCIHSERSEEEYGDWSSEFENYFDSITKVDYYPNVASDFLFEKGDDCFIVWVEYSTGDSFGSATKSNTEIIGVFKDAKSASELQEAIIQQDNDFDLKDWDNKHAFYIKTSDGQEFKYNFAPWSGYFESIDEVHITTAVMR